MSFFRRLFGASPPPEPPDADESEPVDREPAGPACFDEDAFWTAVEVARDGRMPNHDYDATFEGLREHVVKLDALAVRDLIQTRGELWSRAYRNDLWAAAYLVRGGCSDDSFMDFRDWLLCQGREVFNAALADVESLANVLTPGADPTFEGVFDGFRERYQDLTGARYPSSVSYGAGLEPEGEEWEEDELAERFPRLWEALGWEEGPATPLAELLEQWEGLELDVAEEWTRAFAEAVISSLQGVESVVWTGLGTFKKKHRAARRILGGMTKPEFTVSLRSDDAFKAAVAEPDDATAPEAPQWLAASAKTRGLDGNAVFEGLLHTLTAGFESGLELEVEGLGRFEMRDRPARRGKDPRTGEAMEIPATRILAFSPSELAKAAMASSVPQGNV